MGSQFFDRIRNIIERARTGAARSVNTAQVVSNWLIGREIIQEEQRGKARAGYGEKLLRGVAAELTERYGPGYGYASLKFSRQFFLVYPALIQIGYALRSQFVLDTADALAQAGKDWKPGLLNPNLSWTHYRVLLKANKPDKRAFYEIEAVKNGWSARELERQMASLLYERLAKSRDKAGVMRLAAKGQEVAAPADAFKDPVVMEFLGVPPSERLTESGLERALIGRLREFLLEMGNGFAFVGRQHRLTLDGDHFYVDLVFYHAVLKCWVLVDLKVGKLTHQDLGQMQLYVNYFDREKRTAGDGPTIGLILCTDKNDAVVRYTLGEGAGNIFASRYRLHLPAEEDLRREVKREVRALSRG